MLQLSKKSKSILNSVLNHFDLWLKENHYSVDYDTFADIFILCATELKLLKAFFKFPYLSEGQLL